MLAISAARFAAKATTTIECMENSTRLVFQGIADDVHVQGDRSAAPVGHLYLGGQAPAGGCSRHE